MPQLSCQCRNRGHSDPSWTQTSTTRPPAVYPITYEWVSHRCPRLPLFYLNAHDAYPSCPAWRTCRGRRDDASHLQVPSTVYAMIDYLGDNGSRLAGAQSHHHSPYLPHNPLQSPPR